MESDGLFRKDVQKRNGLALKEALGSSNMRPAFRVQGNEQKKKKKTEVEEEKACKIHGIFAFVVTRHEKGKESPHATCFGNNWTKEKSTLSKIGKKRFGNVATKKGKNVKSKSRGGEAGERRLRVITRPCL